MVKGLIAGLFLVLAAFSPAWAGLSVDFGGGPVRALKDGRVVLLLEIRSDAPLREIRIETSVQFPLSPSGARFDEKTRWQATPASPLVLRLSPGPGGAQVRSLDVGILFHQRGVGNPADVFTKEGRERRPSFVLVAVRTDGKEERVEVFLPFVVNVRVSHE
jgi:hypothetical protein